MLADSHCHLDRLDLEPYDGSLDQAVAAARAVGVSRLLCVAIDLAHVPDVLAIAERFENVHASVGVHPLEKNAEDFSAEELVELARHDKVVAIGETGLDYHYDGDGRERQLQNFEVHLEAGKMCAKPVIIHSRAAREDTLRMLAANADLDVGGVMHCFTEDWDMARRAIDLNFYISLSGIVTFRNADALREVAKKVPVDRLLVETDSPYLAPIPYRGKPNEPKYVREVAACIAELRGVSFDALAEQTTENYCRLFSVS